ncbi:MAG: hypothetical protein AM1032_000116 [Mycoplasmataceae bacterium]|nr:MAG: hypothetical protein AM1032_000116 [Mycoplasmataceae bacterium]
MATNTKINTSLRFDVNVYNKIKKISHQGNMSSFVNKIIKEYLENLERENLILAYKRAANNKELNDEMRNCELTIEDEIYSI